MTLGAYVEKRIILSAFVLIFILGPTAVPCPQAATP